MQQCLIKGCGAVAGTAMRGLCPRCSGRARKCVAAGDVTWDQLVRLGLAEPDEADPFTRALNEALKKEDE